jgi:hypothetical protein
MHWWQYLLLELASVFLSILSFVLWPVNMVTYTISPS